MSKHINIPRPQTTDRMLHYKLEYTLDKLILTFLRLKLLLPVELKVVDCRVVVTCAAGFVITSLQ